MFLKCLCLCLCNCLCICICLCQFFGHVMSSHHSEQMSQRSQVSRMALRRCSQNVFVTVLFVFVIFFGHMTCIFSCIWPAYDLHVMSVSSSCHIRLDIATTAAKTSPKLFNWAMGVIDYVYSFNVSFFSMWAVVHLISCIILYIWIKIPFGRQEEAGHLLSSVWLCHCWSPRLYEKMES